MGLQLSRHSRHDDVMLRMNDVHNDRSGTRGAFAMIALTDLG